MNGNEPATKQDIAAAREDMTYLREDIREDMTAMENRLREAMRDIQTEMLKAFYNFAESNNKRVARKEVNEIANRSRIETFERRVTELEQRLDIPPPA